MLGKCAPPGGVHRTHGSIRMRHGARSHGSRTRARCSDAPVCPGTYAMIYRDARMDAATHRGERGTW